MAEVKLITFYLTRLDGELAIRETPVYFPKAAVIKGRTKAEDDRDSSYDVIFMDGKVTVPEGSVQAEWLKIYNSGGALQFPDINDGHPFQIRWNTNMFMISTTDPMDKIRKETIEVEKIVERPVLVTTFAELLTVDQLEQFATSNNIDLTDAKKTKVGMITFLTDKGYIK